MYLYMNWPTFYWVFLAFQIAKYLLYINDRIVNVCKYIYIYTLPTFLHQCLFHFVAQRNQKVYWNSNTKRISITYPEKKDSMNQYFGLSSKEIITRFTVFFVLIVKQRRYFGKKDRLICLWKSPWEGIPSPKFICAKYVAFYSCSFFYLSYSNHTFQCWTGGFTLMRRKIFSRREDLLGSSHRWMKVWMKIHEVFVHARITVKGGGG